MGKKNKKGNKKPSSKPSDIKDEKVIDSKPEKETSDVIKSFDSSSSTGDAKDQSVPEVTPTSSSPQDEKDVSNSTNLLDEVESASKSSGNGSSKKKSGSKKNKKLKGKATYSKAEEDTVNKGGKASTSGGASALDPRTNGNVATNSVPSELAADGNTLLVDREYANLSIYRQDKLKRVDFNNNSRFDYQNSTIYSGDLKVIDKITRVPETKTTNKITSVTSFYKEGTADLIDALDRGVFSQESGVQTPTVSTFGDKNVQGEKPVVGQSLNTQSIGSIYGSKLQIPAARIINIGIPWSPRDVGVEYSAILQSVYAVDSTTTPPASGTRKSKVGSSKSRQTRVATFSSYELPNSNKYNISTMSMTGKLLFTDFSSWTATDKSGWTDGTSKTSQRFMTDGLIFDILSNATYSASATGVTFKSSSSTSFALPKDSDTFSSSASRLTNSGVSTRGANKLKSLFTIFSAVRRIAGSSASDPFSRFTDISHIAGPMNSEVPFKTLCLAVLIAAEGSHASTTLFRGIGIPNIRAEKSTNVSSALYAELLSSWLKAFNSFDSNIPVDMDIINEVQKQLELFNLTEMSFDSIVQQVIIPVVFPIFALGAPKVVSRESDLDESDNYDPTKAGFFQIVNITGKTTVIPMQVPYGDSIGNAINQFMKATLGKHPVYNNMTDVFSKTTGGLVPVNGASQSEMALCMSYLMTGFMDAWLSLGQQIKIINDSIKTEKFWSRLDNITKSFAGTIYSNDWSKFADILSSKLNRARDKSEVNNRWKWRKMNDPVYNQSRVRSMQSRILVDTVGGNLDDVSAHNSIVMNRLVWNGGIIHWNQPQRLDVTNMKSPSDVPSTFKYIPNVKIEDYNRGYPGYSNSTLEQKLQDEIVPIDIITSVFGKDADDGMMLGNNSDVSKAALVDSKSPWASTYINPYYVDHNSVIFKRPMGDVLIRGTINKGISIMKIIQSTRFYDESMFYIPTRNTNEFKYGFNFLSDSSVIYYGDVPDSYISSKTKSSYPDVYLHPNVKESGAELVAGKTMDNWSMKVYTLSYEDLPGWGIQTSRNRNPKFADSSNSGVSSSSEDYIFSDARDLIDKYKSITGETKSPNILNATQFASDSQDEQNSNLIAVDYIEAKDRIYASDVDITEILYNRAREVNKIISDLNDVDLYKYIPSDTTPNM